MYSTKETYNFALLLNLKQTICTYLLFPWNVFLTNESITGEKLVNFLVEPKKGTKWPAALPRFESRQAAIDVCKDLCKYQFMHRSEKRGKGDLVVSICTFISRCSR
jgi:hypothetical protein